MKIYKLIVIFSILINFTSLAQQPIDSISETKVFNLGEVFIVGNPQKQNISSHQIKQLNKTDVAQALNTFPSMVLNHTGSRNESAVYLRGFDIRSVPIYADGIPIYIPYDGYVDLARFTTADLSKIEISKGYSSILYGPNALGGTINLVSKKPQTLFELNTKAGLMSGNGFNNYVSMESKFSKFFIQTSFSQFDRDYITLSDNFQNVAFENDLKRDNSYRFDRKFSAKVGFTPNDDTELTLNYINQKSEKGNPVYLGDDPNNRVRFWQWPYWNKESLYFISNNKISQHFNVKSRIFVDQFDNQLKAFDNANYNTQNKPSSFTSFYSDKTFGANIELGMNLKDNDLKMAMHYKLDKHSQHNLGKIPENMKDALYSIGIENVFFGVEKLKLIAGTSYNFREGLEADNANILNTDGSFAQFPKNENSAINMQLFGEYKLNKSLEINGTISLKSRFATMKDRYSYRNGVSIANPDLNSEKALNTELGFNYHINEKITVIPEIFYSKIYNTIQLINNVQNGLSQVQNTGKSEFYGFDLYNRIQIKNNLDFNLNYTFIKRKNITNPDLLFTDVPEHHLFTNIHWNPFPFLTTNLNAEFSSDRYSTSYGISTPSYWLLNFQTLYKLRHDVSVELGINNIFDKNYFVTDGFPEMGRNIFMSLYYDFKITK